MSGCARALVCIDGAQHRWSRCAPGGTRGQHNGGLSAVGMSSRASETLRYRRMVTAKEIRVIKVLSAVNICPFDASVNPRSRTHRCSSGVRAHCNRAPFLFMSIFYRCGAAQLAVAANTTDIAFV